MKRTSEYTINNTKFCVMYGDITQVQADVLVSSDDNYLSMTGGVSLAILKAAGRLLRTESRKHIPLKLGDIAVTTAGDLPAKYIFHAATIDFDHMTLASEDIIQKLTLTCLQLADNLQVNSIVFPALGTGAAHVPFQLSAEIITRTIANYLYGDTRLERVIITLFARDIAQESDMNIFYEHSVGIASISNQSRRISTLLSHLESELRQINQHNLISIILDLRNELNFANSKLNANSFDLNNIDKAVKNTMDSPILSGEINKYNNQQLESTVLRTKLSGLMTQLNIQIANLNKYQIQKAKFGEHLVPVYIEHAIEEIQQEIDATEKNVYDIRMQLAALNLA